MKEIFEQGEFSEYRINNLQKSRGVINESFAFFDEKVPVFISHKHVGENKNNIELTGKWYGVSYEGSMKAGFTITNKETPLKPSTPTPNNPESNKPGIPNTSNNKTLPKTGDGGNVSQYAWIMLVIRT